MARSTTRETWLSIDGSSELQRLKWLAVLAPVVFLAALEVLRRLVYPSLFGSWPGYVLLAGIVLTGTLFFAETIFSVIGRMQARLTEQNQEILSLHEAGLAIASELNLEAVLQSVVDKARELVGARYGALSLLGEDGEIEAFLTSGVTAEQRAKIGPPPGHHGMLGVVLEEGKPLRTPDVARHPRSVGFPAHHPPMRSLLAVPILSAGRVLGSLYVAEKEAAAEFDAADQGRLQRFATVAALAIENARLHNRVQALAVTEERERIAREMHDSLAQVLGYVNTKAQAAQALLDSGQTEGASQQLGQLAGAAREAYADVREGILGLRTSLDPGREFLDMLREYLERWQDQSGIPSALHVEPAGLNDLGLSPLAEIQLLRIIQEALANVRKHAGATRAEVQIVQHADGIETIIQDNGVGFDPSAMGRSTFPRFGLATMRERAESVGGTLEIESEADTGTRVRVRILLDPILVTGNGGVHESRDRR